MAAREAVVGAELRRRRGRLRATAAVVVLALATVAGVGVGLWVAPSGGAFSPTKVTGLGFLPVRGWTVVQGAGGQAERATALAANVPIDARDVPVDGQPFWTVAKLPANGVVIFATFSARGNLGDDLGYPEAELPVRLDGAHRETSWSDQIRPQDPVAQYRRPFANGGYNVDVRVYVGSPHPSKQVLAQAQRQLDHLVVAAEPVTLRATPAVAAWAARVTFTGSVSSGRAGEDVELEERRCGTPSFTAAGGAHTDPGGGWSFVGGTLITSSYRARWRDAVSNVVTVRARPGITVREVSRGRFSVGVVALKRFEGRTGVLERFDRGRGRWVTVRRFRFDDSGATGGITVWTGGRARARLPSGTLVRAVLPRAAVRPCYLAGYSNLLRTR